MKTARYSGTGETVQVGGLNTADSIKLAADTASSAFAADTIIEIVAPDSADAFISIGSAPTTPSDASGFAKIQAQTTSRPFTIASGDKIRSDVAIHINVVS